LDRVGGQVIEATYMPCSDEDGCIILSNDQIDEILHKCDALAVGMGLGKSDYLVKNLAYLLEKVDKPVVIDADGINMLHDIKERLKNSNSKIILTPHTDEFSRLTGLEPGYIENNREEIAKTFAKEFKCIVLLKGAHTVVTDGEKLYINNTGNPGMASGGSGDALTGIITAFLGQGYDAFDAAALGACIHGLAGDRAYERYGYGLTASDIINFIGNYIKR
jgi:NAD(P)H-hydrate epimerase